MDTGIFGFREASWRIMIAANLSNITAGEPSRPGGASDPARIIRSGAMWESSAAPEDVLRTALPAGTPALGSVSALPDSDAPV